MHSIARTWWVASILFFCESARVLRNKKKEKKSQRHNQKNKPNKKNQIKNSGIIFFGP
jgi:hypothetical protein